MKIKVQKSKIKDCFATLAMTLPFVVFSQDTDTLKTVEVKDVIISSVKASEKDPFVQTVISHKELNERNTGKDLPYLIDNQPSVVSTSDGGTGTGYTDMRVRGSDFTKINVTINGIPMNDAESQRVYFVDVPDIAASTNNIQLQRGVGSSTNGSGAFGASLNIQNNGFSAKPFGYFSTHYGSYNTWRSNLRGGSGLIKNKFFIEGSVSRVSSDGYLERAKSDLWSYHLQAGLVLKKTKIQLVHFSGFEKTYQAWYGVDSATMANNRRENPAGTESNPPYANQIDNYRQHYLQLFVDHSFNANWSLGAAGFATVGKGYYEEYKANRWLPDYQIYPADTTLTEADLVRRRWLDNVYYGGLISANYTNKKVDVKFGGMIAQYQGKHYGNVVWVKDFEDFDPNNRYYFSTGLKRDYNVYAKVNYSPVQWLVLYGDLQYRYVQHLIKGNNNDLTTFDINNRWHFFNPKAGVKFFIRQKHQLFASFAIANREPGRDEQIDNKDNSTPIKPERLYDTEAGYKFSHSRITVDANVFFMYYHNQLLLSGAINDVGNAIKINTPKSFRTGIELAAAAKLWQAKSEDKRTLLGVNANATYSLNRILNFEDRAPIYDENYNYVSDQITQHKISTIAFSPSWISGITVSTEPVKNFTAKVFIKYVSKQFMDNTQANERSIPQYAYGDISLSYLLPLKGNKSIRFSTTVFNFWNAKYITNGWTARETYLDSSTGDLYPATYNGYYPQATVHASGGIEVNF